MLRAKAVLAADTSWNRDISPDGQGLIWYSPAPKANELARRISFLGRNPDFCRALGEGGQQHLLKTRSAQRVGRMYDEVYRHAYSKYHKGDPSQDTTGSLIAVQLCS
jgi:glycosyltransferase involved in cell wall biosynthesis